MGIIKALARGIMTNLLAWIEIETNPLLPGIGETGKKTGSQDLTGMTLGEKIKYVIRYNGQNQIIYGSALGLYITSHTYRRISMLRLRFRYRADSTGLLPQSTGHEFPAQ